MTVYLYLPLENLVSVFRKLQTKIMIHPQAALEVPEKIQQGILRC